MLVFHQAGRIRAILRPPSTSDSTENRLQWGSAKNSAEAQGQIPWPREASEVGTILLKRTAIGFVRAAFPITYLESIRAGNTPPPGTINLLIINNFTYLCRGQIGE